jgi:hypothetical protein
LIITNRFVSKKGTKYRFVSLYYGRCGKEVCMKRLPYILACVLILSACGTSTTDRALSGAGIGAGVGALGSAATGGSAGTGAIIGGAVGAAAGGLTNKKDIDLGKPIWRR